MGLVAIDVEDIWLTVTGKVLACDGQGLKEFVMASIK